MFGMGERRGTGSKRGGRLGSTRASDGQQGGEVKWDPHTWPEKKKEKARSNMIGVVSLVRNKN